MMTVAEQAASVGAEYIRTPEFEGVIFLEGFDCVPGYWLFPYWTPSREVVLAAESRLPAFLRSYPPYPGEPCGDELQRCAAPLILAKLAQYRRQYSGIVFEGHPMLYMNFFARDGWGDWVTHHVEVCDGGHDYFQLVYHPERGEFVRFWVNGEA
jgi:hypothetical protein